MVFGLRPPLTSSCIGTATATSAPLVPGSLLGVVLILIRPVKLYVIIFFRLNYTVIDFVNKFGLLSVCLL